VLNTFCYSGGFSVYAVAAGASMCTRVDSSEKAVKWTDENIALNNPGAPHKATLIIVFDF